MSGERRVPFYCPYCGEQDLVPAGESAGDWQCRSCTWSFQLRSRGVSHLPAEVDA